MAPPEKSPNQRVLDYSTVKLGHKVDRGECWDLAFFALKHAGAKTPQDIGSDLYIWGTPVKLSDAQPGDIIQFEGVAIHREWREKNMTRWEDISFASKHTAIVEKVESGMFFTLLNSNYRGKRKVTRLKLNLSPENIKGGSLQVYRPIKLNGGH